MSVCGRSSAADGCPASQRRHSTGFSNRSFWITRGVGVASKRRVQRQRTKHVTTWAHRVREATIRGIVEGVVIPPAEKLTDRQARALIVAAEAIGLLREPYLLFWQYDESLRADADRARAFLETNHPDVLRSCLSAPDPIPAWVAARRIVEERGGLNNEQITALIDAALERGLDLPQPDLPMLEWEARWERARHAVAALWECDPQLVSQVLGDQGRIAPLPESAVTRCPSCCDNGWVPHPYAGSLPTSEPEEPPF
jgi:hypothetical protein